MCQIKRKTKRAALDLKQEEKMFKDTPEEPRQMHVGHVLTTACLADILIADETLRKQPRETQLS